MDFMDCSPKTKRIDSTTFDFPEPFGPTTDTIGLSNSRVVFLEKDLIKIEKQIKDPIQNSTQINKLIYDHYALNKEEIEFLTVYF